MTFEEWMALVDQELDERIGMTSEDLEDWNWRDAYDDDTSPRDAVDQFLEDIEYEG